MMTLQRATANNVEEVVSLFRTAAAEITPMPTRASIEKAVLAGRVVWSEGIALMHTPLTVGSYYGIRLGIGAVQIQYLCASSKGDGSARRVVGSFCGEHTGHNLFLLVRSDNSRAISFYKKLGFIAAKVVRYRSFNSILMVKPRKGRNESIL